MLKNEFETVFKKHKEKWEKSYTRILEKSSFQNAPRKLKKAMLYSLKAGGKRLRPVIFLESSKITSINENAALGAACAFECLHTYSLIHDDLPSMDNDDFRRGKQTNHKVFGEDTAILAGDALQSSAFELLAMSNFSSRSQIYFAKAAGAAGMVGGQILDCEKDKEQSARLLKKIHNLKTGKLIQAAIVIPFIEKKTNINKIKKIENWALEIGELFQAADDLLDETGDFKKIGKSVGKDKDQNKLTYVSIYGIEKTKNLTNDLSKKLTKEAFDIFPSSKLFQYLPEYIISRVS
ncbi:MAG: polyprenyl synthetase family protein [Spirochaetia bacterium]|nr:polyprenyl synthetase family protein [Spirochaetia bacterium]